MKLRQSQGRRPQITFTSDFHELVQGDLIPGPCVLRYDPLRLLAGQPMDEDHHIVACVRFHPGGREWQGAMTLPRDAPMTELADPAGQGLMLEIPFTIPEGCRELEVWFYCRHADGYTHWDSDFGRNHWLRFPLSDLSINRAEVRTPATPSAQDVFELEITSAAEVSGAAVRWWVTNPPQTPRRDTALGLLRADLQGKLWSTPEGGIPVPKGATVAFDVIYHVGERRFTDDNQGRWYLAD